MHFGAYPYPPARGPRPPPHPYLQYEYPRSVGAGFAGATRTYPPKKQ